MANIISASKSASDIGAYYSQNSSNQNVNSSANQNSDKNTVFNSDRYNSVQSVGQFHSDSASANASVEKFAARGWNVSQSTIQQDSSSGRTSSIVPNINALLSYGANSGSAKSQVVGSSFDFIQTGVPSAGLNNLSAYNAISVRVNLDKLDMVRPYNSLMIGQSYRSDYLAVQNSTYDSIYQNLSDLRTQAAELQNPDIYNVNVANSSAPNMVTAVAGPNASSVSFTIDVSQLAQPEVLASAVPTTTTTKTVTTTTTNSTATPDGVSATTSDKGGSLESGTHYYRVSAVDSDGHESVASQELSAVTTGKSGSVSLEWSDVANAKSYKVYVGTAPGNETSYYTSNNASLKVTGSGNGVHSGTPLSTADSFTTTSTSTVTATVDLAPNDALGLSGTFSVNNWDVSVAKSDSLYDVANRINSGSSSPTGLAATGATQGNGNSQGNNSSTTGGALTAGTRYYRIAGVDSRGNESAASSIVSAGVSGNNNSVSLSWDAMTNAESYKVYFGTSQTNLNQFYLVDGAKTSFSDTGATNAAIAGSPTLNSSANNAFGFGTSQYTGVSASVSNGQLLFVSQNGGGIALDDTNGVLQNLGMLYKNPLNGSVAVNNLNPQYQAARSASFSVDGAQYSSPVNGPIKVAGYELNLVNTGAATISATQDASIVLRSVNNFINSYNQAIGTMNQTAMSGGAIAENLKMQEIYSEMVRFFNSPPPASFNGTRSLSDVGVTQSDSKPTSIQETVLAQLASKETGNNFSANSANSLSEYFPSGQGILSLIHQSGSNGVNSPDNFKMTVDSAKLRDSLLKNPAGTGAMLDYAASRLQSRLDVHLQPGYGTLAFQKKITGYYANNQQVVASLMSNVVGISTNNFNSGNTKTLLGSI